MSERFTRPQGIAFSAATIEVTPAFRRDFATAKAAKESWFGGDDWVVQPDGSYVSWSDILELNPGARPKWVNLRFGELAKLAVVDVAKAARTPRKRAAP